MAQCATPEQISQLFSPLIARFDQVAEGARELDATREANRNLSTLRDELVRLAKQHEVTSEQYDTISNNVFHIIKKLANI